MTKVVAAVESCSVAMSAERERMRERYREMEWEEGKGSSTKEINLKLSFPDFLLNIMQDLYPP